MNDATRYLGDGVYVAPDADTGGIVLTTGAHHDPERTLPGITNQIFAEPEVMTNLYRYLREFYGDT